MITAVELNIHLFWLWANVMSSVVKLLHFDLLFKVALLFKLVYHSYTAQKCIYDIFSFAQTYKPFTA